MKVCALIPALNEVETIATIVAETHEYVDRVLVIDDGSDDCTAAAAKDAGADCICLERTGGKGTALRKGLEEVHESDFSHLLFIDGDGQHRPKDIPVLLEVATLTRADMVIGARTFDRNKMPWGRFFSNSIASKVASWLAGMEILDSQSGFRLIRREILSQLTLRSKKYEFEMEVLLKLSRKGCSIEHAPVKMIYEDGKSRSKMKPVTDPARIFFWSLLFRFFGL